MSARPGFADLASRSLTTFVGGINPWTNKAMPPRHQTAHLGSTPFATTSTPAAKKKSGPPPGTKYSARVDLTALKIEDNVPLPRHNPTEGKWAEFFADLKPKQAIKCKSELVQAVASAMRKFIKENKKEAEFTVIQQRTITADPGRGIEADDKHGRVWMWPKEEAAASLPPRSRGGVTVGAIRRAAKVAQ